MMTATDSSGFDVLCSYDADGQLVGAALAGRSPVKMDTVTFDSAADAAAYVAGVICSSETGERENADRPAGGDVTNPKTGAVQPSLVSAEKLTNRVSAQQQDSYYSLLPDKFLEFKLTRAEWLVLLYLASKSNRFGTTKLPQVVIGERLKMRPQHVSRAIKKLASHDILACRIDAERRRSYDFNPELMWNYTLAERNRRLGRVTTSAADRRRMKQEMRDRRNKRGAT